MAVAADAVGAAAAEPDVVVTGTVGAATLGVGVEKLVGRVAAAAPGSRGALGGPGSTIGVGCAGCTGCTGCADAGATPLTSSSKLGAAADETTGGTAIRGAMGFAGAAGAPDAAGALGAPIGAGVTGSGAVGGAGSALTESAATRDAEAGGSGAVSSGSVCGCESCSSSSPPTVADSKNARSSSSFIPPDYRIRLKTLESARPGDPPRYPNPAMRLITVARMPAPNR